MDDNTNEKLLNALQIAFCYMPKAIEVNKYDHGDGYQKILEHIEVVRSTLLQNDIDPDEVYGDIFPENTPNSSY